MLKELNIKSNIRYPRPDFMRNNWLDLNGIWQFQFDDENAGEKEKWHSLHKFIMEINVPFVYQSELSGINKKENHDILWYKKTFEVSAEHINKQMILNFGAVDFHSKVWINDCFAGEHFGGYSNFSFNITEHIKFGQVNEIVVRVEDEGSAKEQPRGKQGWLDNNFGCWYTKYSGIWQSVWIDILDEHYIESFKITPDIDKKSVDLNVDVNKLSEGIKLEVVVTFKGKYISSITLPLNKKSVSAQIDIESMEFENGILLWHPNNPNLYDIKIRLYEKEICIDEVESYFGMRKISIKGDKVLLNNVPIYQKLVLDQGYFDKGFITPSDEQALIDDVILIKELGFNGVRKHQKIEDPRFLYWCDKLGLLVWEEMPSQYAFSNNGVRYLLQEWQDVIQRDYNHPCIITWVIFNESWGISNVLWDKKQQEYLKGVYNITKCIDDTRIVIDNDGWEHTETDITTIHDYVGSGEALLEAYMDKEKVVNGVPSKLFPRYVYAEGYKYNGQPIILSEYGGISFATDEGWGYNDKVKDSKGFIDRFKSLTEAVKKVDYICGYCYTQLTDVEQEQNGLVTIDRKPKIDISIIKAINDL